MIWIEQYHDRFKDEYISQNWEDKKITLYLKKVLCEVHTRYQSHRHNWTFHWSEIKCKINQRNII